MYDLIVIGSGPGGYVASIRAAQLGLKTAVIEKSELGGVCLNWGCIPTKALLKSVQALQYMQKSVDYGITINGDIVPDIASIVKRSRGVSESMSRGVDYLLKKNKVDLISGYARIVEKGKVEVTLKDGSCNIYETKNLIIATGARAKSLPFAPIDGDKIISYKEAMVPERLPETMAVIGSGAIGSEFAYFYNAMGVKVHLIEFLPNIVPQEDDEVSAQLSRSFRKSGIKVYTSSQVKSVVEKGDKLELSVDTKKGEITLEVDRVLSAVGVEPNIEGIGLENACIETEKGKIKVSDYYSTNVEGIYAIGDVINTPALAHVASAEAICCVEKIAGLSPSVLNYNNFPSCIYTFPEVASTGMTERGLKENNIPYKIGKFPFTASGKATAAGDRDGFVKLLVCPVTDAVLGAHLIGSNVTEMISGIIVARDKGVTAKELIKSIHPHPTMSEAIMEAAAAAHGEVIHI